MSKHLPKMRSDKEAEDLLEQDISEYLHPQNFTQVSFEFLPKDTTISLRISSDLLEAIQTASSKRGISYQKFIREAVERSLQGS